MKALFAGCLLALAAFSMAAGVGGVRERTQPMSHRTGIGHAERIAVVFEHAQGMHRHAPVRTLRLSVRDQATGKPAVGASAHLPSTDTHALVDARGFAILIDDGAPHRERIEITCPSPATAAVEILHDAEVELLATRADATFRVDLARCRDRIEAAETGRFSGLYRYTLEADWLFPCDGTRAVRVRESQALFRDAERLANRSPWAEIRRNGAYVTMLGAVTGNGNDRNLEVGVPLSLQAERPQGCRTPEYDSAIAMRTSPAAR